MSFIDINIEDIAREVWDGLSSIGSDISNPIKKALDLAGAVFDGLKNLATAVGAGFIGLGKYIYDGLTSVFDRLKDGLIAIAKAIFGGLETAYSFLKSGIVSLGRSLEKFGEWIYNGVKDVANYLWKGITYVGKLVWDALVWVYDKIKEVISWIIHKFWDIIHVIVRTVVDAYNWTKDKLVKIADDFGSYIGNGIVFTANRVLDKLPMLFAVNYGIDGINKGLPKFVKGDIFGGLKNIILAPIGGYIAGELLKALIDVPAEMTLPFVYTGSVPDAKEYEAINPAPITTFSIETPLVVGGDVSVNIVRPIIIEVTSPIGLSSYVNLEVIKPLIFDVTSPIDVSPYVRVSLVGMSGGYSYSGYGYQGGYQGGGDNNSGDSGGGSSGGNTSGTIPPSTTGEVGIENGGDLTIDINSLYFHPNDEVRIMATLINGFMNGYDYVLKAYLCGGDNFSVCKEIDEKSLGYLSSGQSATAEFVMNAPTQEGYYEYVIIAYLIYEGSSTRYDKAVATIKVINPNEPIPK